MGWKFARFKDINGRHDLSCLPDDVRLKLLRGALVGNDDFFDRKRLEKLLRDVEIEIKAKKNDAPDELEVSEDDSDSSYYPGRYSPPHIIITRSTVLRTPALGYSPASLS